MGQAALPVTAILSTPPACSVMETLVCAAVSLVLMEQNVQDVLISFTILQTKVTFIIHKGGGFYTLSLSLLSGAWNIGSKTSVYFKAVIDETILSVI